MKKEKEIKHAIKIVVSEEEGIPEDIDSPGTSVTISDVNGNEIEGSIVSIRSLTDEEYREWHGQ